MDDESTFSSRPQAHSVGYTFSSASSAFAKCALTLEEREHVDSADAPFNQCRCLIENYPNDHSVQYCHMVSRQHTKNEDLMAALEWYWNMRYNTLNLNTRYNIFFVGAALHLHHENDAWGLLPEEAIIDQYHDTLVKLTGVSIAEKNKFPEIPVPKGGFKYRFIPLGKSLEQYRIVRQNAHTLPLNKDQYTFHFYPFDTLPPLCSHLHPKFAIFELGRKYHELLDKDSAAANEAVSSYPRLDRIYDLYTAWTILPNTPQFKEWKKRGGPIGDRDRQPESS